MKEKGAKTSWTYGSIYNNTPVLDLILAFLSISKISVVWLRYFSTENCQLNGNKYSSLSYKSELLNLLVFTSDVAFTLFMSPHNFVQIFGYLRIQILPRIYKSRFEACWMCIVAYYPCCCMSYVEEFTSNRSYTFFLPDTERYRKIWFKKSNSQQIFV